MNFSDNYVTGDNVFLRELQDFFFLVLGMMSITHYGAVGDGRKDNYGPLQVAIDDAHRRGLGYIYVPFGRYIYTGNLINLDGITFIGNPRAKIVNIRTGVEIPIKQFGIGANNYSFLINKPSINGVTLDGDLTTDDLHIVAQGRNIVTLVPSLPTSLQNGNNRIVFDTNVSNGTRLEAQQSFIKVGTGVTKIDISGCLEIYREANYASDAQDIVVDIRKSGTPHDVTLAQCKTSFFAGQQYAYVTIPPRVVSISGGDELYLAIEGALLVGDSATTNSRLTAEVVAVDDGGNVDPEPIWDDPSEPDPEPDPEPDWDENFNL